MSIKHHAFWAVLALAPLAAWTILHKEGPDTEPLLLLSEPPGAGVDNRSAASAPWLPTEVAAEAATGTPHDAGQRPASLNDWQNMLATELAKDPTKAWRHALQLATQRPDWAEALVQPLLEPLWQRREFELVLKGLDEGSLPAALRESWTTATLARWTEFAPAQAATWAASRAGSSSGAGSADLLAAVNDRWAHQDARSATVFASTLKTAAGQALLTESLSRWLAVDGTAARGWIRAQGASESLDAAIAAHATQDELARQAPQEAIDLVRRIADPVRRNLAQWTLARTLRDIDATRQDLMQQALQGAGEDPEPAAAIQHGASDIN